jgi:hypothetical protein
MASRRENVGHARSLQSVASCATSEMVSTAKKSMESSIMVREDSILRVFVKHMKHSEARGFIAD